MQENETNVNETEARLGSLREVLDAYDKMVHTQLRELEVIRCAISDQFAKPDQRNFWKGEFEIDGKGKPVEPLEYNMPRLEPGRYVLVALVIPLQDGEQWPYFSRVRLPGVK